MKPMRRVAITDSFPGLYLGRFRFSASVAVQIMHALKKMHPATNRFSSSQSDVSTPAGPEAKPPTGRSKVKSHEK
jgi:hypothetical protein